MNDKELFDAAKSVCKPLALSAPEFSAGTVGAALLTAAGNVYTGICIDLACGLGFCAEASAAAEMLKHGETHIVRIVAVFENGESGTPCGRCREMLAQIDRRNLDCTVLLGNGESTTLRELLPMHWLEQ